jgi:hypothetical protein
VTRAVVVAIILAVVPMACATACSKVKKEAPVDNEPPPLPVTSATTPPIWHPPEPPAAPATSAAAPPAPPQPSPDFAKARAAADAKDFKKVRTLLEKKVRGGKGTPEEVELVHQACVALKDKACTDALKAKHPDGAQSPTLPAFL